ncbi:MAG: polymer-forming cytoskeletal protein [Gemmatimonadota bacterium]|nr:polymer-forming cytoskeletal protein [Gemmatimonadota bacterium]
MTEKMSSQDGARLNTIIGQGTVIKGECSVNGTVRVDGIIDGSLQATGMAILGKVGQVKGDLEVENAVIGGKVEGSVTARGRLELQTGASIQGDVTASKLAVEEGVFFDGRCCMDSGSGAPEKRAEPAGVKTGVFEIEDSPDEGRGDNDDEITFKGKSV